jgi:hypothetical protein
MQHHIPVQKSSVALLTFPSLYYTTLAVMHVILFIRLACEVALTPTAQEFVSNLTTWVIAVFQIRFLMFRYTLISLVWPRFGRMRLLTTLSVSAQYRATLAHRCNIISLCKRVQ